MHLRMRAYIVYLRKSCVRLSVSLFKNECALFMNEIAGAWELERERGEKKRIREREGMNNERKRERE